MTDDRPLDRELAAQTPVVAAGLADRFPIWSLGDVAVTAGFFLLAGLFFTILALLIASSLPMFQAKTAFQILSDIRIAVMTQFTAYLATFWFVYRMIARHYGADFLEAIRWAWPRKSHPAWYVLGGIGLAYFMTALQSVIPMPAEVPLDKFLKSTMGVWVLAIFGSLLAPFAEEVFFRGLLFPALARRTSVTFSVAVTSLFFALLHGTQLGWSWGPLLLLFSVGAALTLVRAFSHSVAASALVHVSYNVTLFTFLYIGTNGFRNLDKVIQ